MSSPLTKGQHTRQVILDAAHDLILEQGYAGTSMRQIANRAGLALGGIYNHFPGKEAIFKELILEHHPYRQVIPVLLNTPTDDLEAFVRAAAKTMLTELGRNPDFMKLMLVEIVEFNGRNLPGIITQILPQILPFIEKLGQNKTHLRNIPPFIFFRAFLGLFFSFYITEMIIAGTPLALTQKNSLDYFVEIFLHGALTDKESA